MSDKKTIVDDLKNLQSGEFKDEAPVSGDTYLKYKVKPKISFKELMKGNVLGAVENTTVQLEFGKDFKQADVELTVKVNGNIAAILNSPSGKADMGASVAFTKKF